jgi:protein phosphatase
LLKRRTRRCVHFDRIYPRASRLWSIALWRKILKTGTTRAPRWQRLWMTAAREYRAECHDRVQMKPTSLRGKIASVALTDTGKVREHNEDMIGTEADIGLFVLADGMGGYNAGEVASGIAVKTIINLVRDAIVREDLAVKDPESGLTRPSIILRDAIHRANKIIYHTSKTQPQCEGMGTTVVACLFHDNKMSIAHVGDSRLYRLRDNRFEQMTLDHSLLQELVDRGFYSQQEAQRATNKNYVTRALGVEQNVEVEIHEQPVQKSDYYVLCSDGLSDMIEDEDIHLTISTFSANLDTVAKQLIQLSNDNGGRDNVSVIMAHVEEPFPAQRRIFDKILGWFG